MPKYRNLIKSYTNYFYLIKEIIKEAGNLDFIKLSLSNLIISFLDIFSLLIVISYISKDSKFLNNYLNGTNDIYLIIYLLLFLILIKGYIQRKLLIFLLDP